MKEQRKSKCLSKEVLPFPKDIDSMCIEKRHVFGKEKRNTLSTANVESGQSRIPLNLVD